MDGDVWKYVFPERKSLEIRSLTEPYTVVREKKSAPH